MRFQSTKIVTNAQTLDDHTNPAESNGRWKSDDTRSTISAEMGFVILMIPNYWEIEYHRRV